MGRFIILLAVLLAASVARAGHFYLDVTLRDGKKVKGYLPETRASFEGVTSEGKAVTVRLEKLPDYAKRDWSQEILWDEKLALYVLRAPSWTGLLKRIWERLELDAAPPADPGRGAAEKELDEAVAEQKKVAVKGSDVAEAKIRYVDPAKEVIKPEKDKKK